MTKQEVFEYIRDNLKISVSEHPSIGYGYDRDIYFDISLVLTNPEGKSEVISSETLSVPIK